MPPRRSALPFVVPPMLRSSSRQRGTCPHHVPHVRALVLSTHRTRQPRPGGSAPRPDFVPAQPASTPNIDLLPTERRVVDPGGRCQKRPTASGCHLVDRKRPWWARVAVLDSLSLLNSCAPAPTTRSVNWSPRAPCRAYGTSHVLDSNMTVPRHFEGLQGTGSRAPAAAFREREPRNAPIQRVGPIRIGCAAWRRGRRRSAGWRKHGPSPRACQPFVSWS